MTLTEQNQIIKDSWTRQIQESGKELPEDIGNKFADWIRNIIEAVRSKQVQQAAQQKQEQTQGGNA